MFDTRIFVSLAAALAACLASLVVFLPHVGQNDFAPLAVVFAMIFPSRHVATTVDNSKRGVIGALIGALSACAFGALGSQWRLIGLLASFPVCIFFGACDASCRTPLERFIWGQVALVVHYAILAFGPDDMVETCMFAGDVVGFFAAAAIAAVLVHVTLTCSLNRRGSFCVHDVLELRAEYVKVLLYTTEGILAYLATGNIHRNALETRLEAQSASIDAYDEVVAAWKLEPWSAKPSPETMESIKSLMAAVFSQQWALLQTFGDGYTPETKAVIWDSIEVELQELKLSSIAALRVISDWAQNRMDVFSGEAEDIDEETVARQVERAHEAADRFKEAVVHRFTGVTSKSGSDNTPSSLIVHPDDIMRTHFACHALQRLAHLVVELFAEFRNADACHKQGKRRFLPWACPSGRSAANVCKSAVEMCSLLFTPAEYFKPKPTDAILDEDCGDALPFWARARPLLRFPLRLSLCCHLCATLLLMAKSELPDVYDKGLWAVLPCVLCFLPTTGAAMLKSFRRALGTIAGGAVSLICLYGNPNNPPALFTQLFIVTFIAKYASQSKTVDYAGLTFGLTWHVVVLTRWNDETAGSTDALHVALWRIGMTTAGSIFAAMCSMLFFPTHATVEFEHRSADALLCATEMTVLGTSGLIPADVHAAVDLARLATKEAEETYPGTPRTSRCTTTDGIAVICEDDDEKEHRMRLMEGFARSNITDCKALLVEADAESIVVPRRLGSLDKLQDAIGPLINCAASLHSNKIRADPSEDLCEVARVFMTSSKHGMAFAQSILSIRQCLHTSAVSLALQLRGMRIPKPAEKIRDLRRALRQVQHHFSLARKTLLEDGLMPQLIPKGILGFYSQVHGLASFAKLWLDFEEDLFEEARRSRPRGHGGPSENSATSGTEDGVTPSQIPSVQTIGSDPSLNDADDTSRDVCL